MICQVVFYQVEPSAYIAEYAIIVPLISLQELFSQCYALLSSSKPNLHIQSASLSPIVPDYPPPNLPQNRLKLNTDLLSMRKTPCHRVHPDNPHTLSVSQPGDGSLLRPYSWNEPCSDSSIRRSLSLGPRLLPVYPHPAHAQKNPDRNLPPCLYSLLLPRPWCSWYSICSAGLRAGRSTNIFPQR